MSDTYLPAIAAAPFAPVASLEPDPVFPFRWRPLPWFCGGLVLLTLQLAVGTDATYALLIFAFVNLTGLTLATLDGITTVMGCCVGFLAFQHVLFCQTLKVVLWQRPDAPMLCPVETAGVYVVGMSSLLVGALLWRQIRPVTWKPMFRREIDPRRLLWMTFFCTAFSAVRFILARSGSHLVGINAADIFVPLSIAAGTAYTIVDSRGRRSFGWANAVPILLSFLTGAIGASRLSLLTGPVIYYLTCYAFRFRFRPIHLGVLLAGAYIAQFILFPYALYARNYLRSKDLDVNAAHATDLLIDVMMDPIKYQENRTQDKNVDPASKRLRYFGAQNSTLDRFTVILWADAIIDAELTRGTTGMKWIEPGFSSLLPRYLDPLRGGVGTSNALGHRAKGLINKYDPITQITLGFFCDAFTGFAWMGIAIIPALILLGYSFLFQVLFDRTLWRNVLAIAVTMNMAWTFSEATIAPQISSIVLGFIIYTILISLIRAMVNQTQNYHDARQKARAVKRHGAVESYPA